MPASTHDMWPLSFPPPCLVFCKFYRHNHCLAQLPRIIFPWHITHTNTQARCSTTVVGNMRCYLGTQKLYKADFDIIRTTLAILRLHVTVPQGMKLMPQDKDWTAHSLLSRGRKNELVVTLVAGVPISKHITIKAEVTLKRSTATRPVTFPAKHFWLLLYQKYLLDHNTADRGNGVLP